MGCGLILSHFDLAADFLNHLLEVVGQVVAREQVVGFSSDFNVAVTTTLRCHLVAQQDCEFFAFITADPVSGVDCLLANTFYHFDGDLHGKTPRDRGS